MHATFSQHHRRSALKYEDDQILSYRPAASATFQGGSDRVIVISRGSKGWAAYTTAAAMVLIALATLVGGGMTTWHYWNEESRAAQSAQQAAMQRHMEWWKGEMQWAEAGRQLERELGKAGRKTLANANSSAAWTTASDRDGTSNVTIAIPASDIGGE